ncbi:MAG: hypothetical protein ACREPB_09460 [Arenimonas sp.]
MSHNDDTAMQSHVDDHTSPVPAHDDAVLADHHQSQTMAATEHSHHPVVAGKCHGKACQQKCNCGCGMNFCSSTVASLLGSPLASFLLKGSDGIPSLYDQSVIAARGTSPLRPPIS